MALCRRRERAPDWLWLVVSLIIWLAICFPGGYVVLALDRIAIVILGILGALAFAGGFSLLIRRIRGKELALLAGAGLVGGVVFAATGPTVEQSWMSGGYLPSPVGFAAWQAAVGTVLVWMASRGK
jgi:drug/metabolite transporter (DMT)-like permease